MRRLLKDSAALKLGFQKDDRRCIPSLRQVCSGDIFIQASNSKISVTSETTPFANARMDSTPLCMA